jgi:isopentenyl diphosphate isomerase/L-lactate dehydrogenase-like FMN-dependent dehydrogenase
MLLNVEDLRRRARRRLPRAVFDFIDGGAEDERTLRRNTAAFERLTFSPRILVDVDRRDQSTTVLGQRLASPLILAPTGLCGMAAPRGEVLAARAALRTGTVFTLSCMSAVTIEELAREVPGPHWFQLYVWRDRALTRSLVERARAAGYRALVLTADAPVVSHRERDLRNGATIPPRVTWRNLLDSATKLGWLSQMARHPRVDFVNVAHAVRGARRGPLSLGAYVNRQFDPSVTWDDLDWLRSFWPGPLALKGIMSVEDARRAVEHGVDLLIVSNHGGRQLDGLPAAVEVLPEIAEAVGGRAEIVLDGGVRRGGDVVKALALGARACMIGRPYLYGLGAGGQAGVERAVGMLQAEIDRTLALLGRPTLAELDRTAVRLPPRWPPD